MSVSVVKFMGFHLSFITLLSVFIRGHNIWEKIATLIILLQVYWN